MDQSTVRQGRGRLKMFLNLKCIFAPFAFVLFYYLHNYFKYKTLFTIHSVVIIIFLGGTTLRWGGGGSFFKSVL